MSITSRLKRKAGSIRELSTSINPVGAFNRLSPKDAEEFAPTLGVWRPEGDTTAVFLRWQITTWCNYSCAYCDQPHNRSKERHAFDNHSPKEWLDALDTHFGDRLVTLVITGGETMLDKKSMPSFLKELTERSWVRSIRLDTNVSWSLSDYKEIDTTKIALNCSYHPS